MATIGSEPFNRLEHFTTPRSILAGFLQIFHPHMPKEKVHGMYILTKLDTAKRL